MLRPCADWAERLSAYLDGECTQGGRAAVEAHLRACPACRTTAELYRCDRQDASTTLLARGASTDFSATVMARIRMTAIAPAPENEPAPSLHADDKAAPGWSLRWLEWAVVLAVMGLTAIMLFPVFAKAREKASQTSCVNNQRQLVTAMQVWAQDHDGRFPPSADWSKALTVDAGVYQCPSERSTKGMDYAYNAEVADKPIQEFTIPDEQAVTFDARDGLPEYRHNRYVMLSFVDGHVAAGTLPTALLISPAISAAAPGSPASTTRSVYPSQVPTCDANITLSVLHIPQAKERARTILTRLGGTAPAEKATNTLIGTVPMRQLGPCLRELDKLGSTLSLRLNNRQCTTAQLAQCRILLGLTGVQGDVATATTARAKVTVHLDN